MKKALIGYGGHAKEVMAQMGIKLTCFVDDKYVVSGTIFIGTPLTNYNVALDGYGNIALMVSPFLNTTITHTINYEVTV
jgi:hypothetical protein